MQLQLFPEISIEAEEIIDNLVLALSFEEGTGETIKAEYPFYQIYRGAIDEVRVWYRLLDEDEIIDSINAEMSVNPQEKLTTTWGKLKH